ncbi:MAG TPA: hypothetical protein VG294_02145 [Solirubrobacteraceae bacterium]|nr:hypothetical protein [Solirubrobacteraceae bacterium]
MAARISRPPAPLCPGGGRLTGRWRYDRTARRGIALRYDRDTGEAAAIPAAALISPLVSHSPMVRVLCYCGVLFTFDGDAAMCPGCGQPAEWPTMGVLERELRADLEELFREHE